MTIVYTAILGGSDSLKPAPKGADRCVCFVDDPAQYPDAKGWELIAHRYSGDPRREAWRLRCVPHTLFPKYDRVIWIDASFTLTNLPLLLEHAGKAPIAALRHHRRQTPYQEAVELVKVGQAHKADIDRQVADYRAKGYPGSHLSISCIIVRDHSDSVHWFNVAWQAQIEIHPGDNTQVSLDFCAWFHDMTIKPLMGSRLANPYSTHDGADHKKRRRPYLKGAAA